MGIFNWIILTDEFVFEGSIEKLNEKIRLEKKSFRTEWTDYNKFKFVAKWSLGTFMTIGGPISEGINGFASIEEIENEKIMVSLKSKVRLELFLITLIAGLILTVGIAKNEKISPWLFLLLPFLVFWFWFIYRLQEKALFQNLKKTLTEK